MQAQEPFINRYSDFLIGGIIIGILVMMIIPLPTVLLDGLLALNLTFALVVILSSIYILRPLDFNTFPTILLGSTLFSLGLNVSTTRTILSGYGQNLKLVTTFGNFVVGGNTGLIGIVTGLAIFVIIIVIMFVVISKGATRVSEVRARFTLDGLPGKQMQIDGALSNQQIDLEEATRMREELTKEVDFFGQMDGASKFVSGNVIASLIITFINIIGGLVIGMVFNNLDFQEALDLYTRLTIGDGLLSQIPALLVAVAMGILITRASSEYRFSALMAQQLFSQPKVLFIGATVLIFFSFLPGFPKVVLILLAGILAGIGYIQSTFIKEINAVKEKKKAKEVEKKKISKPVTNFAEAIKVDTLALEVGLDLIPVVDKEQGGDLLDRITLLRRQIAVSLGIEPPPIRIRDNMKLPSNEYVFKVKGVDAGRSKIYIDHVLAMESVNVTDKLDGEKTKEPAFGFDAIWIPVNKQKQAERAGYTVVDPPTLIVTHITEILKKFAPELLGRQETQKLIDMAKQDHPVVVEELIPNKMTVGEVQKVLKNLLAEEVAIRDIVTILETLADNIDIYKDNIELLTEKVRISLGRQITNSVVDQDNQLNVITIGPRVEDTILQFARENKQMDASFVKGLRDKVDKLFANYVPKNGTLPSILCSTNIRRFIKNIFTEFNVLAYEEVSKSDVKINNIGVVE